MSAVVIALEKGNPAAVLLVFFVPGYLLTALLFPGQTSIDWIERLALSLGLSVAVVALSTLLLNYTPWGVRLIPIVMAVVVFSVLVGIAAYRERLRLSPHDRLSATIEIARPAFREYRPIEKVLVVILLTSILLAGFTLLYIVTRPAPSAPFTQFYIDGPGGNASGYPTRLNISQPGTVFLGIVNHEAVNMSYRIRVDLVGIQIVYNPGTMTNETMEVNRTTWSTINVTLRNGQNWTLPYTFRIDLKGVWKVQFLLFKEADISSSYRELHLFVRVT